MKSHFARHGIPDLVISDNWPQFYSEEFARFAKAWSFEHRTSSPGHRQANGMAEAAVKSAKSLIRDPYLALLDKRNTQTEGDGYKSCTETQGEKMQDPPSNHLWATESPDRVHRGGQETNTTTTRTTSALLKPRRKGPSIKKTSETPASPQARTKGTDKESLQPSVTPPKTTNQPAAKPTAVETPKPTEGFGSSHPNPDSPKPQTSMRPKRVTKEPSYLKDYVRK